jgi:hypothetical protein
MSILSHELRHHRRFQLNNPHFSDYTLYPDRFANPESSAGQPIRRNSLSSEPGSSVAQSPPLHGPYTGMPITKYNFRIR